mmetsp:Transcript_85791/g.228007  ORF Transcript_85791/g.228007 Transcript_85791/m.228007 type:complete len:326 (-) Transcript_85791:61-1038(-)
MQDHEDDECPARVTPVALQNDIVRPRLLGARLGEGRACPARVTTEEAVQIFPAMLCHVKLQKPLLRHEHADLVLVPQVGLLVRPRLECPPALVVIGVPGIAVAGSPVDVRDNGVPSKEEGLTPLADAADGAKGVVPSLDPRYESVSLRQDLVNGAPADLLDSRAGCALEPRRELPPCQNELGFRAHSHSHPHGVGRGLKRYGFHAAARDPSRPKGIVKPVPHEGPRVDAVVVCMVRAVAEFPQRRDHARGARLAVAGQNYLQVCAVGAHGSLAVLPQAVVLLPVVGAPAALRGLRVVQRSEVDAGLHEGQEGPGRRVPALSAHAA